ncbi:MAG: hypothetical protein R3F11_27845 [Verrucomicrobiales bacterium]
MKSLRPLFIAAAIASLGFVAYAQETTVVDTPPTLSDVTPVAGTKVSQRTQVFSGTAAATGTSGSGSVNHGIDRVLWRIQGDGKWRKALLSARGEQTTTFTFKAKLRKGEDHTRVIIRAIDEGGRESDWIVRKIRQ